MALVHKLGSTLGNVVASFGPVLQEPAVSVSAAEAVKFASETSVVTGVAILDGKLGVGVVTHIFEHAKAGFAKLVSITAAFAPALPDSPPLPTDVDGWLAADAKGTIDYAPEFSEDGLTVKAKDLSVEVLGLVEGQNRGQVILTFDDAGY